MAAPVRLSVALVTETYPPEVNGVAMTLGRLTQGLSARGHRVMIARPRQHHERSGRQGDQLLTPGLPIPRYPQLRFGLPSTGQLRRAWWRQRPDIVHVATEGPLGLSALAAARQLGIPVVSTFHTNYHRYSRHYGLGWLKDGIEGYLRWFHNRTLATLVPTAALAAELTGRGFRHVSVLARGVDTALFRPERRLAALRAAWGAGPQAPVLLHVGRLAPEKNLDLLFRAHAAIRKRQPQARLVCVGDGPLLASLRRDHPDCLFVGAKLGEELAAHYASADLFLFPSLTETYGNVVAEALASGLPVVAFDLAAAGELIREGENGLLAAPGDAAAFIAAASRLAASLEGNPKLRENSTASIRHLDWNGILDGYAGLLAETSARHAAETLAKDNVFLAPD